MTNPSMIASDATSDDRLWALLAYIFTPIVPIILMVLEDKKNRPFIRAHNAQALALGVIQIVLWITFFTCVSLVLALALFIAQLYWGFQAYGGKYVNIPVISDLIKKQGWA